MNYSTFSPSFAKILITLFSAFFVASAHNTDQDFLHCLDTYISDSTSTNEPIIYTRNDPSYFTVLNSSINNDRFSTNLIPKPFVIITPFHASHIQATVFCSKKHGVQIRTRSGGHDYEGLSYVSYVPFVVIDLKNLNLISVDVETKTAWAQAGATIGELYYGIGEKSGNLGFPAGDCHTVGLGGQIGGGGYGYLTRKYGLAAENILDAKLIDAEGRILDRKSMGEDLFWAIRGGGPESFGIVLEWKLQLVSVPLIVTVFDVKRNMEDDATKKAFRRWQRVAHKVDEDLSIYVRFQTSNSTDAEGNKKIVLDASFRATFHGGVDTLLHLMEKDFPELGLLREECTEMRWVESFLYFNLFRNGEPLEVLLNRTSNFNLLSFKAKSDFLNEPIPDDALDGMLERLYELEVGSVLIDLFPFGGRMDKILESVIPFPHRAGNLYTIHYLVQWPDAGNITESKKHIDWVRRLYDYMTPYVSKNPRATYLNFRDLDIGMNNDGGDTTSISNNIAQASIWGTKYFKNNFKRLLLVKTRVDPTNIFRNEQSIPPLPMY